VKVIDHLGCKFLIGNEEGKAWYDPIKPYTKLEYEWVLDNITIAGKRVVDAGAHHGHYTLVFKDASEIICIEPDDINVSILELNLEINDIKATIYRSVIGRNNLPTYAPGMDIVKMDIEGAEFAALPHAIKAMPTVKVWIVEIHPGKGSPIKIKGITDTFIQQGFDLLYVNRSTMSVDPYVNGQGWTTHTTLIARKP